MRALARELRRRGSGPDGGFTLVELLVAIILLAVVIGLSTGSLITALDQQSNLTQSGEAQSSNQNGVELLSRLLRQAVYPTGSSTTSTILSTATDTKIVFTSQPSSTADATAAGQTTSINTAVRQYTFELDGTTLNWNSALLTGCTGSTCTYGTATALHPIVRGVRNTAGSTVCPNNTNGSAVFSYVYLDPNTGLETTATTPVSSTLLGSITYVKVVLYTQTQTGPLKPACVPLTDYVQLRNKA